MRNLLIMTLCAIGLIGCSSSDGKIDAYLGNTKHFFEAKPLDDNQEWRIDEMRSGAHRSILTIQVRNDIAPSKVTEADLTIHITEGLGTIWIGTEQDEQGYWTMLNKVVRPGTIIELPRGTRFAMSGGEHRLLRGVIFSTPQWDGDLTDVPMSEVSYSAGAAGPRH